MAIVPAFPLTRRAATRGGLLALPLVAALLAGCVTTNDLVPWKSEKKAENPVCQICCMWQNSVQFAADPTRQRHAGAGAGRPALPVRQDAGPPAQVPRGRWSSICSTRRTASRSTRSSGGSTRRRCNCW